MIEYTVKVYDNGDKHWYLNGNLHREDGPAIENSNGDKHWYLNGELHREDGPAVEYADGDKHWYLNGKRWYLNGKRHREDGPAVEYSNGYKSWYLNGEKLTKKEWKKRIKKTHKIIIDGKEIELSDESFQNIKKAFDKQ